MSTTDVRLLYPNLGQQAGDVVTMEAATARLWVHRRLAEPVDEEAAAAIHDAYRATQLHHAAAMMAEVRPQASRSPGGPTIKRAGPAAPPMRPVNRTR